MYNEMVDQIEVIRKRNNVYWMEILRLALEVAPERTKNILRQIEAHDTAIALLLKQIGES